MSEPDDDVLAQCVSCETPLPAIVVDETIHPIGSHRGGTCPNCGAAKFIKHPLVND